MPLCKSDKEGLVINELKPFQIELNRPNSQIMCYNKGSITRAQTLSVYLLCIVQEEEN